MGDVNGFAFTVHRNLIDLVKIRLSRVPVGISHVGRPLNRQRGDAPY